MRERNIWSKDLVRKATLTFRMKHKWFEMIRSGDKNEEYRDKKKYWITRVMNALHKIDRTFRVHGANGEGNTIEDNGTILLSPLFLRFIDGYKKNAEEFTILCKSVEVRNECRHAEWGEGEYDGKSHYVFHLGPFADFNGEPYSEAGTIEYIDSKHIAFHLGKASNGKEEKE